ncbi:NAD(P)H-dependent oxidoreductase [Paenibacillus sp. L3-i20]|uniref:NAD(P)H-dependent oxidoreductase n=1 Tax=Paenibacillus sp. L3-i20 TaxID=2905833 RepID=UPI001EDF6767|nr:NAD(P)H-dependent oxidoreductase [Paenibacillus sp. L3-i20]GKU80006.1 general stress protein 14 [Paenibacillus sp. L3-i20]
MKTIVIVAHPNISSSRINKAWVEELQKHEQVTVHQLYEEYPNEDINIAREQSLLVAHDRIIFQYPLYWYSSPSLLKKWYDTVLHYGWAYGPDGDNLHGKSIGVAISTHGTTESYQPGGSNLYTIQDIVKPVEVLVNFVNASYLPPFSLHNSSHISDEQLEQSKQDYVKHFELA